MRGWRRGCTAYGGHGSTCALHCREELPTIYKCPHQGCTAVYRGADGMKVRGLPGECTPSSADRAWLGLCLHGEEACTLLWGVGWTGGLTPLVPLTEACQGAPRGGPGEALPTPWLQQSIHDRPLPAAPCQAHPHRCVPSPAPCSWGSRELTLKKLWRCPVSLLWSVFTSLCVFVA